MLGHMRLERLCRYMLLFAFVFRITLLSGSAATCHFNANESFKNELFRIILRLLLSGFAATFPAERL